MKKLLFSFLLLCAAFNAFASINASVTYATFLAPEQPYLEVYLFVEGNSVEQVMNTDSLFQPSVEVIMMFKQGEDIVKADKYILNGGWSEKKVNLYDLKRYALANGEYLLEVIVKDTNNPANLSVYRTPISVDYQEEEALMQSDLQLLRVVRPDNSESIAVKNGYYMEAIPFNFYYKNTATLYFYNELYNADKAIADDFLVRYTIEKVNGNGSTEAMIIGNKKRKPEAVSVLLYQMDISKLPSGNYNLVVEIRDRIGTLLSERKVFFQRSNPFLDEELAKNAPIEEEFVANLTKEELRYSLKAIAPIAKQADSELINILIANEDSLEQQRRYLFSFWAIQSPVETEKAYRRYMEVAKHVDLTYNSGFGYGFESDRGYIYMKYGAPNDVRTVETDPTAPPYEIWVYERFPQTKQSRVKFLFYNPSLAPGAYQLLHSTARSEVNNPQWELELYRDAPNEIDGTDYISGTRMQDNFNRNARRLFEDL